MITSERRGFDRLMPLAEALGRLLRACEPMKPQTVPLESAIGHVAAESLHAAHGLPHDAIALRDGFAVASMLTVGATPYAPVFATETPPWLSCGAALPQGTDALLPVHAVQDKTQPAEFLAQAAPGDGVRAAGADFEPDKVLVEAGRMLRPIHAGLLHAAGIDTVQIRAPRLDILIRNDLQQDLIGPSLAALASLHGATAKILAIDMNDLAALQHALAASDADLVISVGGTGFGTGDHAAAALQQAGTLFAHGLALRPGETMGCGMVQRPRGILPVILAPGRFEAAIAAWLALAKPALRRLSGAAAPLPGLTLPLARKITSNPGVGDLVLLRHISVDDKFMWEPLATGDLPWQALAQAEAWCMVAPESEGYPAGAALSAEEF